MNIININESNHMNAIIFTWKPSDWGKTMEAALSSKIYFARFDPGWGNKPLQFT